MASLNARASAVALIVGSSGTAALCLAPDLIPLRMLSLALAVFGAWGFADEMGLRKPLNRAGMVALAFAGGAKTLALLDFGEIQRDSYLLLYAFSLLLALLLWSLALLHRDRQLKIAGALGAVGAAVPILTLIAGHIFVGAGALWGIATLYDASTAAPQSAPAIIVIIETIFLGWSILAAGALWTGRVVSS